MRMKKAAKVFGGFFISSRRACCADCAQKAWITLGQQLARACLAHAALCP
jgi:hypothetical protein